MAATGAALTAVLFSACGTDSRNALTPTAFTSAGKSHSTVSSPKLTRDQALVIAQEAFSQGHAFATAVENPHGTVSRLMRFRELRDAASIPEFDEHRDAMVWIVQVEGTSHANVVSLDSLTYRFNAVLIDAVTGVVISHLQLEYEPFILPLEFIPAYLLDTGLDERDIQRDALPVSRDEAVQIVLDQYGEPGTWDIGAIETSLVMYSNPVLTGDISIGPTPTPTSAPTTTPVTGSATPTPDLRPVPTTRTTAAPIQDMNTPVVDRLNWMVVLPSNLSFNGCFVSGPPAESHLTCWMSVSYFFIDAFTGELIGSEGHGFIGPSLTNDELLALQHYAWTEGWWSLWHEVHQYNSTRLPEGLALTLDRPDAPTPTPLPPTATPQREPLRRLHQHHRRRRLRLREAAQRHVNARPGQCQV